MSEQETRQVRIGFIGCGGHSSRTLQPNAHLAEEVELVAMCDLEEAKARGAAERWGVKAWYTDMDQMLSREELDAVVVVGPPAMMQPITKEMLTRGVHVLTEKPPAMTAALAKELVDASEASGAVGMVATHWRHAPTYSRARELMNQEGFGAPSHCHGWFYAPGPIGPIWGAETGLMGYLLAQGVHLVDCTRSLMGDVVAVSAAALATDAEFDSCAVTLTFASGATGTLSMVSRAPYWTGHRVFGCGGGFVEVINARELRCGVPPLWTGESHFGYEDHPLQTWGYGPATPGYSGGGYVEEIRHFAQSILAGEQPVASVRDGYEAMRVLEAVDQSVSTGKTVAL